jgi:microsomal dipeptidase-like Zn-dependent dipeptidase
MLVHIAILALSGLALAACELPTDPPDPGARPALSGWVDLHAHPMSYLGFGGKAIAGGVDVGSPLPVDAVCDHHVLARSMEHALGNDNAVHGGVGLDNLCGDIIRNLVVNRMESLLGVPPKPGGAHGASDFALWPAWNDVLHQKMWIDWIRRAWQNGQRVMVALAVNNKTLADAFSGTGDGPDDDAASSDLQTDEMKNLVARHSDFMEIAYSSGDLQRIVASGKLAVVLGMEIDHIGNLTEATATPSAVHAEIDRLFDNGIRYLFPVHIIDNAFGGTAIYQSLFDFSNYREDGEFWDVSCSTPSDGISLTLTIPGFDAGLELLKITKLGIGLSSPPPPPSCSGLGHRNARRLSSLGMLAIQDMMRLGMFVDIDHMSQASVNDALALAEKYHYPLMSGHNTLRDAAESLHSENDRTLDQLQRIAALHGMLGLGMAGVRAPSWEFNYARAVTAMPDPGAISLGTDLNGMAEGAAPPRYASKDIYDTSFAKSSLGTRTWDYNTEGVAHYGMLADFLQDVRTGLYPTVYEYVNRSAEYFYQTWQRCEASASSIP